MLLVANRERVEFVTSLVAAIIANDDDDNYIGMLTTETKKEIPQTQRDSTANS